MIGIVLVAAAALSAAASRPEDDVRAVATYESAGLYWDAPGAPADCAVKFRKAGQEPWRRGLDLWFDARNDQCRGSLVELEPGTRYEARVANRDGAEREIAFTTRAERVAVARVVKAAPARGALHIREGGSPSGYVVYEGGGATIDVKDAEPYDIEVDASYVVVRGWVLKGAQRDAIRLGPHATDVVIEDNDISGWGRPREPGNPFGADMDAGIRAMCRSCPMVERITIQRNRIHDPRYTTNSWSEGHPAGPQAIAFSWCGGELVVRHNEMGNAGDKRFNDVVGGEENFSHTGFPDSDSDIYGNLVRDASDDGIEAEGGNRNVRVWGNYIDQTATGVATTVTSVGPIYLFRNVYNRSRFRKGPPDMDERQAFFKSGSDATLGHGRRYIFHNTMLQAQEPGSRMTLGAAAGISGTGADQPVRNTVSRNNIFHAWRDHGGMWDVGPDNDFGYDLYFGEPPKAKYQRALSGKPQYAKGNGWEAGAEGRYQLARGSPGFDAGVRIPNFNDGFQGKAPDVGAHEAGTPPMRFGLAASRGPAVPGLFVLLP